MFRLYEIKQYKKANKTADQILRAVPDHGETLAMKGLIVRALDQREEAYDLARRGLRQDIRSQVAWHILGLLHRHDREYKEASKAYQQALRLDPNNAQLLRELSPLQAHTRDFEGLLRTREQMLQQRPTLRMNWLGLAVANHLLGRHEEALQVLDAWERISAKYRFGMDSADHTDLSLVCEYRLRLLEEAGLDEAALRYAQACLVDGKILDRTVLLSAAARLAEQTGDRALARDFFWQLLKRNPDNTDYLEGMLRNDASAEDTVRSLDSISEQLRADGAAGECISAEAPVLGCALGVLRQLDGNSSEFQERVKRLMRWFLDEAQAPSLFRLLEKLYEDPAKMRAIDAAFRSLVGENMVGFANESTALFAAEHCMRTTGDPHRALEYLKKFPDSADCAALCARVWRTVGAYRQAFEAAERARRLDERDRALNSLAAEYALLAGESDRALELVFIFTHDGETPQIQALYNLQVMWFELAYADAAFAEGRVDRAMKYFSAVLRHFADFREDEFDFHAYCLRKSTISAYVDLVQWEDRLYDHAYYRRALCGAVRCYLALHRNRATISARLARLRLRKGANTVSTIPSETVAGKRATRRPRTPGWMEIDPEGASLVDVSSPLAEAEKLVFPLLLQTPCGTQLPDQVLSATFEVALESSRYVLAARAVVAAFRGATTVETLSPTAVRMMVRLSQEVMDPSPVAELVKSELDLLLERIHIRSCEHLCEEFFRIRGATDLASVSALAAATGDEKYLERGLVQLREAGIRPKLDDFEEAWRLALRMNINNEAKEILRAWYPFADILE
jgi:peptide alpha-N-acetyltransferase